MIPAANIMVTLRLLNLYLHQTAITEVLAAVGMMANIVQLVDFGSKVLTYIRGEDRLIFC